MNERILTLAASHFPRDSEGTLSATPEMITGFAELIVRECVDVARQADIDGCNIGNYAWEKIKEHFGVES